MKRLSPTDDEWPSKQDLWDALVYCAGRTPIKILDMCPESMFVLLQAAVRESIKNK